MEIIIPHTDDVITEHASTTLHLTDLVRLLARQAARKVLSNVDGVASIDISQSDTDHE
jgi:hypothetical protein